MKFAGEHIQKHVRRMTNWQRNQWAKAGYPTDKESLEKFDGMACREWGKRQTKAIESRKRRVLQGSVE